MNVRLAMKSIHVLFCPLAVFLLSGCATMKYGGGPVGRTAAMNISGLNLAPESSQQNKAFAKLDKTHKWSNKRRVWLVHCGKTGVPTCHQKYDLNLGKVLESGWCFSHFHYMEDPIGRPDDDIVCQDESLFVPGYPLIWPFWFDDTGTYQESTNKEVGRRRFWGLGLGDALYMDMRIISPASYNIPKGFSPKSYNAFNGFFLAAGLIGGGRMNNKYYGQLLWIAFPVGSAH